MSDPTAETPASPEAGQPQPVSETAAALAKTEPTIRDLLEAGVHFGHQTRRWNPRMRSYLFGERNGVHIIDLDQTLPRFKEGLDFLRDVVAGGGKILMVATKRQAQEPIKQEALRAGQYYVNNRWLGGMLTNFKTVKKSIERFKDLLELTADEEKTAGLSKKEMSRNNRQIGKYTKSLDGIKEMTRLPDALFVIDVKMEAIAISEAQRLGIPIVAIVDSNCNPYDIEFVVPGNDDSIRAIQLYCSSVADVALEGAAAHNERMQSQVTKDEKAKAAVKAPSTGRVVVEISQPPRRGRGASFGEGAEEKAPEKLKSHEINPRAKAAPTAEAATEAAAPTAEAATEAAAPTAEAATEAAAPAAEAATEAAAPAESTEVADASPPASAAPESDKTE